MKWMACLTLMFATGCAEMVGVTGVRPAACEVFDARKAAFPIDDAGRPVREWALVTGRAMDAACK